MSGTADLGEALKKAKQAQTGNSSSSSSSNNSSNQQAAMDIAITRLTFNEATSTNQMLRAARLDAVAAAKKRGAGSLHGWLDALAMSSEGKSYGSITVEKLEETTTNIFKPHFNNQPLLSINV